MNNALPHKPEPAPTDPRVRAFLALVAAVDDRDTKACLVATRELRGLGFSVVYIGPQGQGGRR